MKRIFISCMIAALTFTVWALLNRPVSAPSWSGVMDGLAYSPMRPGQSPARDAYPSEAQIEADIAIIAAHARSARTYGIDGSLARIPAIAAQYDLPVTVGVALGDEDAENRRQLARLSALVGQSDNIERIVVGNETVLNDDLSPAALGQYLAEIRAQVDVPVSTAEPWHVWLQHPELADEVDYLTVHLLPYWEGTPVDASVALLDARMSELAATFEGLPIVIGEVGWPSHGRTRGAARATRADAASFLRQFLQLADRQDYDYFVMEAFDQPWKQADEGAVGAYWGLFDGARRAKYEFEATLLRIPAQRTMALVAALISLVCFALLSIDSSRMQWRGLALLGVAALAVGNAIVWLLQDYVAVYWTAANLVGAVILLGGLLGIVLLIGVEVHEWAEARYVAPRRLHRAPFGRRRHSPMVSIHVPAYAEPPAMLVETLNALARLHYRDFEVIVIDNNTTDEALWRPVEAHCAKLGERFRFFHVENLPGYKAGALNYAMSQTDENAEIVTVVDADYVVEPNWLSALAPLFDDSSVGLVQAPQSYRDRLSRTFKRFCEAEYRGFFHIGMVTRNERNAIIQHGTMTMIRARALQNVGGWAQWTVTEDAELGLRVLRHGYQAIYTDETFGRGLTPDRFRDYRSQRFRWAIGAMQILRHHGRALLGLTRTRLTAGQRFHFLAGWAAWIGDGLNLIFNLIAIGWSVLMVLAPLSFLAPAAKLSAIVLAFFAFKLIKMGWLYGTQVRAGVADTLAAVVSGLSLVFITGCAVIAGATGMHALFVRTPKLRDPDGVWGSITSVACELLLATTLIGLAAAVALTAPFQTIDRQLWSALLLAFATPHAAAVAVSLLGMRRAGSPAPARLSETAAEASQS